MSEGVAHALDQALAFWRAPALLASARHRPLPDDVLDVVRIAAGDSNAAGQGAEATGADPGELTEAAAFYLQQLLFAPGTDSYRVLGVNPGADDSRIKEHYRWLVRWLHPDRNPDEWEALYADRVNRAWQDLRTPAKRAAYDATLESADPWGAPPVGGTSVPNAPPTTPFPRAPIGTEVPPTNASEPLLSARTARRLPYIVLGGFGAIAGALLTLMWYAHDLQPIRALPPTAPAAQEIVAAAVDQTPVPEPEPGPAAPAEPAAPTLAAVGGTSVPIAPQPVAESAPEPPAKPAAVESPPASVAPPLVASAPTRRQRPPRQAEIAQAAAAPVATPAPAMAEVQTDPAPAPPTPITESQATPVLAAYTTAYATGDIASLMQLFTQDASGPGGGRDSIAADYQSLFDNTRKRRMVLQRQGWLAGPERATVLARFEARLIPSGGLITRTTQGDIRFDLGWEDGKLRIRGISHVED